MLPAKCLVQHCWDQGLYLLRSASADGAGFAGLRMQTVEPFLAADRWRRNSDCLQRSLPQSAVPVGTSGRCGLDLAETFRGLEVEPDEISRREPLSGNACQVAVRANPPMVIGKPPA